ncbi:ACP S-malonyltransferase [Thiomonas sp. FB-Cd]|uniref:ACP S-malonyltransferase n=1 Tax=Thiomonas sp. FB-Cd TaxID=1158292 RepID=UPI0004DF83C3|nr:ACP S-malonyltransferase [Thiomonas sp. FB-Cd]
MKTFAFVFPGQGSQAVGMLDGAAGHTVVRETLQEAGDALRQDIGRLIAEGPAEALNLTTNTQPVMLTAGVALWRLWRAEGGGKPQYMAGHSLGEYTALVAGGAIAFADALPLVRFRAQVMQEAVPVGSGGMAAVLGLDDAAVRDACAEAATEGGEVVEAVNFNAPGQVVIAGTKAAVERACILLKARGAKRALPLPVSAPFHSSLLKPAAERLAQYLEQVPVRSPDIPVIHNVDVAQHPEPQAIRRALAAQAASPVRWVECVHALAAAGCSQIVECGPGKVLAGLSRRIDPALSGHALVDLASAQTIMEALL